MGEVRATQMGRRGFLESVGEVGEGGFSRGFWVIFLSILGHFGEFFLFAHSYRRQKKAYGRVSCMFTFITQTPHKDESCERRNPRKSKHILQRGGLTWCFFAKNLQSTLLGLPASPVRYDLWHGVLRKGLRYAGEPLGTGAKDVFLGEKTPWLLVGEGIHGACFLILSGSNYINCGLCLNFSNVVS